MHPEIVVAPIIADIEATALDITVRIEAPSRTLRDPSQYQPKNRLLPILVPEELEGRSPIEGRALSLLPKREDILAGH
jgi:hypothetical protein